MKSSKTILLLTTVWLLFSLTACTQEKTKINETKDMENSQKEKIVKTDEQWKKELSPEQFFVLRQKGTERPFTGELLMNKEKGVYKCAACGNELFTDEMKFDSHCGWPSFDKEISGGKIKTIKDTTHGMIRTEIVCAKCDGHLGHLFDDGPTETGMRYCVNSLSLEFVNKEEQKKTENNSAKTLLLGGGCYWCVEAVYEMLDGVVKVESGFSGGKVKNPSYEEVCSGNTGHAEVVKITYDDNKTSFEEILKVFFTVHDPTTLNRQGADVGTQYRSVIYYNNEQEKQSANQIINELNKAKVYSNPIVTEVSLVGEFYKAKDDHQNYYQQNKEQGYCRMVIKPKVEKFEKVFKDRMKK
jgi:peptide methionine sulfoxide reductase msrA/msrB